MQVPANQNISKVQLDHLIIEGCQFKMPNSLAVRSASHADCRRNDAFKFALTNLAMQISFHDTSIHFVAPGIWNRPCGGYYVIVANMI